MLSREIGEDNISENATFQKPYISISYFNLGHQVILA